MGLKRLSHDVITGPVSNITARRAGICCHHAKEYRQVEVRDSALYRAHHKAIEVRGRGVSLTFLFFSNLGTLLLFLSFILHMLLFLSFVQTNKSLKPTTNYKNLQNLQEPTKTYKNTSNYINTQQLSTQLSNTLAVPNATRPAQRHCGEWPSGHMGWGTKGPP